MTHDLEPYVVTIKVVVTLKDVADLMVSAIEGGSNYWIDSVTPVYTTHQEYSEAQTYGPGLQPRVFKAEDDDTEYTFDHAAIQRGLQLMATGGDNIPLCHWQNLVSDNADAETADVFLQLCLFGEIVYG